MIARSMGALTVALALTLTAPWLLEKSGLRRVEAHAAGLPQQQAEIGINLDMVADWAPAWVFVDVFKHARPWIESLRAQRRAALACGQLPTVASSAFESPRPRGPTQAITPAHWK